MIKEHGLVLKVGESQHRQYEGDKPNKHRIIGAIKTLRRL